MTVVVQNVIVVAVYVQPLSKGERREELRTLLRRLRSDRPLNELIVAGDLNNPSESPAAL